MHEVNAYESSCMSDITGETLRPGGFLLTEKAMLFSGINSNSQILDLGCGEGATLGYLYQHCGVRGKGIDPSIKLLTRGKENHPMLEFIYGSGNELPFRSQSMSHVFAECTLSLMDNLAKTLQEVYRILKPGGFFIITDVYAKNPENRHLLDAYAFSSCMRGLHHLEELKSNLENLGFTSLLVEDYSELLKEMMVKIIFCYGSMDAFWGKTTENKDYLTRCTFQEVLKPCKPGYFMMILRKE